MTMTQSLMMEVVRTHLEPKILIISPPRVSFASGDTPHSCTIVLLEFLTDLNTVIRTRSNEDSYVVVMVSVNVERH